jgi:hypothetical protein
MRRTRVIFAFDSEDKLWVVTPRLVGGDLHMIRSNLGDFLRAGMVSYSYRIVGNEADARKLRDQVTEDCEPYGQFPDVNR